jgi:serine/threonine-protein kinase RsbW
LSAELSLKVETRVAELERISAAVKAFGEQQNWPANLIFKVTLVLEELGINIMNNGYDDGLHEFEIVLTSEPDTLRVEVLDDGRPFDPLNDAPIPDLESSLDDRPVGGLGIYLVRSMVDRMHYRRTGDQNRLTLEINLAE